MADVTHPVRIFEQIRLVAGLRWRILRNSLRKKNNRLDLIGLIFTGVFGSIMVFGLCIAFYAGAYASFSQGRLEWMALLFWAIFLFWQIFPVLVAGLVWVFGVCSLRWVSPCLPPCFLLWFGCGFCRFSAPLSGCRVVGCRSRAPGP